MITVVPLGGKQKFSETVPVLSPGADSRFPAMSQRVEGRIFPRAVDNLLSLIFPFGKTFFLENYD